MSMLEEQPFKFLQVNVGTNIIFLSEIKSTDQSNCSCKTKLRVIFSTNRHNWV